VRFGLRHVVAAITLLAVFAYGFALGKWRVFPNDVVAGLAGASDEPVIRAETTQFDYFAPKVDVVFVGDSITAAGNWHDMYPSVSIANRGVGSDNLADIERRLDDVVAVEADRIFVMAGINDVEDQEPFGEIVTTYEDVLSVLTATGARVYLQSTLECTVSLCGDMLASVRELNERLEAVAAADVNIDFVDINAGLSDGDGLRAAFTTDGIHLNPDGYVAWQAILAPYVEDWAR